MEVVHIISKYVCIVLGLGFEMVCMYVLQAAMCPWICSLGFPFLANLVVRIRSAASCGGRAEALLPETVDWIAVVACRCSGCMRRRSRRWRRRIV